MRRAERIQGCLWGMALGDAFGAPTEFLDIVQIQSRWPPSGPTQPHGAPVPTQFVPWDYSVESCDEVALEPKPCIRVTDDTQMALSVGFALQECIPRQTWNVTTLGGLLRKSFLAWYESSDNNRAPGNTCLVSCERLRRGLPWLKATDLNSKSCGANMRVPPVGLLPTRGRITSEIRAGIAQFQAAMTHAHPTALAASDLTAHTITLLLGDTPPEQLLSRLYHYTLSQRRVYHEAWLGSLWKRSGASSGNAFIQRGWEECIFILDRVAQALQEPDRVTDPCLQTGAGWVAEESLATGLLCFLLYPNDPVKAIRRAAVTSGDSDSIASLTGAFAGAYHGMDAWPPSWRHNIEYHQELTLLSQALIEMHSYHDDCNLSFTLLNDSLSMGV